MDVTGSPQTQSPVRVNGQIRALEVELFDCRAGIKRLGIMPVVDALALARATGTDLIDMNPGRVPPRCCLIDLGRFQSMFGLDADWQTRAKKSKQ